MTTGQGLWAGQPWMATGYGSNRSGFTSEPPADPPTAPGRQSYAAFPYSSTYRAVGCSGIPAKVRCIAANSGLISACHCGVSHGGQLHV
jgi:hypothetical protein